MDGPRTIPEVAIPGARDVEGFIELLALRVTYQARYFRYRGGDDLRKWRILEDAVDRWIARDSATARPPGDD